MKRMKKPGKIAQAILDEVVPDSREPDSDEDETRAKIVGDEDDINDDNTWNLDFEPQPKSSLRAKNAQILGDIDKRYGGKRTSRKVLKAEAGEIDDAREHESAELGFMFEAGDEDDSEDESDENEEDDENEDEESENDEDEEVEDRVSKKKSKSEKSKFTFDQSEEVDYGAFGDSGEEDGSDEEDDSDAEGEEEDDDDAEEEIDDGNKILRNDVKSEVAKGLVIKKQLSDWDSLFECRIQIQKVLPKINQFPQPDVWSKFLSNPTSDEMTESYVKNVKKSQTSLANLLDTLIELRVTMMNQNPELKAAVLKGKRSHSDDDDEEDEDDELKVPAKKMKLRGYEDLLKSQHESLRSFRDATIEKWNDKTRLATGHLKAKSFAGFESSTLQQIEHILADKSRLVKRTQLKRSAYQILGQKPPTENGEDDNNEDKEYDVEIFDDDDFYHQLLRELIERKTEGITDPMLLGQKWLQIQKMRNKIKKKVDTRASKGRKTRFDIHAKLVNFMAPVYCESVLSDEAKTELFKSLFGKSAK